MMVDQEEKTFGSVASLATGLTSAPTDMLYCFSGFVVLTQIFDVINFFSKWVNTKQTETQQTLHVGTQADEGKVVHMVFVIILIFSSQ